MWFVRSNYDSCVYFCNEGGFRTYILLYVDDMVIASESILGIQKVKNIFVSTKADNDEIALVAIEFCNRIDFFKKYLILSFTSVHLLQIDC